MLLLCYLFNEDVNIFFMTVKSQRLIGAPSRGEPPPHLSLLPLSAGACGLYWGGEHYHGKVCRFKMVGFSGDVRNDWSLSGSFSFLNFVCLVIELSFGENIHEDRATKFQTMQPQVSRTCSFLWIDTYLFFFFSQGWVGFESWPGSPGGPHEIKLLSVTFPQDSGRLRAGQGLIEK